MGALLLGGGVLLVVLLLLKGFVGADVKALMRSLRFSGAAALLLAAIGLAFLDRVGLAMLAGSFAWGLFTGGHAWPHGRWFGLGSPSGSPSAGGTSSVQTEWLAMELDHHNGEMEGRVLKGEFAGRGLASLGLFEALELYRTLETADRDGARLLATYLERRFGSDWAMAGQMGGASDTEMTRREALRVLGLEEGASVEAINVAYRRLMAANHPDRGGSSYLAAKINEARDILLPG